jgi:predicted RNase H-like nuclease (RuvC/YqgF family)
VSGVAGDDRDRDPRELEATVIAMRDALELAQREGDERLQAERAQAAAESEQLRTMIAELRRELETQDQRHAAALQEQRQLAAEEMRQLHATIRTMRGQLDGAQP